MPKLATIIGSMAGLVFHRLECGLEDLISRKPDRAWFERGIVFHLQSTDRG